MEKNKTNATFAVFQTLDMRFGKAFKNAQWRKAIVGKSQINANVRIVGKYTISLILICTGYFMPAIRDGIQFQKFYFVLAISCQHFGEGI